MGTTWKPVQPTEIKDINIIREVIAQIRKPIPPETYARLAEQDQKLKAVWEQMTPDELSRKWAARRRERAEKENGK